MSEKTYTFEENILKLEGIIDSLEKGDTPLEECISLFEEGVKISKLCMTMLDNAEQKIRVLSESENGDFTESDFVPDGE